MFIHHTKRFAGLALAGSILFACSAEEADDGSDDGTEVGEESSADTASSPGLLSYTKLAGPCTAAKYQLVSTKTENLGSPAITRTCKTGERSDGTVYQEYWRQWGYKEKETRVECVKKVLYQSVFARKNVYRTWTHATSNSGGAGNFTILDSTSDWMSGSGNAACIR